MLRGFVTSSGGGLSTSGKVFVPIAGVLALLALGAAYLSYKAKRGIVRRRKTVMGDEVRDGLYLDEVESYRQSSYCDSSCR